MENYKENNLEDLYLDQLKKANRMVETYFTTNPPYDLNDLFRIAMNSFKTPEELLKNGLRRRFISGY